MLITLAVIAVGLVLMLATGDCIPARRIGFVLVACAACVFLYQLRFLLPTSAELATIGGDFLAAAKWLAIRVVGTLIGLAMLPVLIFRALSGSKN